MTDKIDKLYLETRIQLHDIRDKIGLPEYMSMIMTEAGMLLSILDDEYVLETIERLKGSVERFREARKSSTRKD